MQDRYNVDSPMSDLVQPPGNYQCVCYSVADICADKYGFDIDIDELYSRVPHYGNGGTDPHQVIQEVLDHGVVWKQSGLRSKPFLSSRVAHKGPSDAFDNVRGVIESERCSIMASGPWSRSWGMSSVMDFPGDCPTAHCVSIKGWDIINGEPQLIIEAHLGRFLYCSRAVFNAWARMSDFDSSCLSEKPIITYWQKLLDLCTQALALLIKNNKMNFDTPQQAYHSVRVMCDNAGMTVAQKNDLCVTIYQESQFLKGAIGKPNANGSKDWGICQFNDGANTGWIGKGKLFSSTQDCLDNPERAVATMIQEFKNGHANWWMGYAVRQQWLAPNSPMWLLAK